MFVGEVPATVSAQFGDIAAEQIDLQDFAGKAFPLVHRLDEFNDVLARRGYEHLAIGERADLDSIGAADLSRYPKLFTRFVVGAGVLSTFERDNAEAMGIALRGHTGRTAFERLGLVFPEFTYDTCLSISEQRERKKGSVPIYPVTRILIATNLVLQMVDRNDAEKITLGYITS
jgi:hypothetical protein